MLQRNDNGEAAQEFYEKRRRWMDFACECEDLSPMSFRVGYWLARKMNGDDQCCWWSVKQIAKQLRKSRRTIIDAIAELEASGLLIVVRQKGKGSTYHLRLPYE